MVWRHLIKVYFHIFLRITRAGFNAIYETIRFRETVIFQVGLPESFKCRHNFSLYYQNKLMEGFFRWRQLFTNSNLFFGRWCHLHIAISSFSFMHRDHILVEYFCFMSENNEFRQGWTERLLLLMIYVTVTRTSSQLRESCLSTTIFSSW